MSSRDNRVLHYTMLHDMILKTIALFSLIIMYSLIHFSRLLLHCTLAVSLHHLLVLSIISPLWNDKHFSTSYSRQIPSLMHPYLPPSNHCDVHHKKFDSSLDPIQILSHLSWLLHVASFRARRPPPDPMRIQPRRTKIWTAMKAIWGDDEEWWIWED